MKVNFTYDKEKDVWCLLNKGKSSNNSQIATKIYQQLIAAYGENPTTEQTNTFIEKYISDSHIGINEVMDKYQKDWDNISDEFQKRAQAIFSTALPNDVTAYLTVNTRCPYSIESNYFFVSVATSDARKTIMHELWHFYTWYGLGADQEEKLGKQKYNDLKEALTVLLNVECNDLMQDNAEDEGYSQHKETRERILELWKKDPDIKKLWQVLIS